MAHGTDECVTTGDELNESTERGDRVLPWFLRWRLPRERPLLLIVGRRGSGKTLLATEIAVKRLRRGEDVYANYPIYDRKCGRAAGQVFSLLDVTTLSDCTVIIDEANLWTSSREWSKIPASVLSSWQQSRKNGVCLIFTSQHEERVDVVIRQLCDWVVLCDRVPLVPRWVPIFRTQWTYLEEVSQVRRGAVSRPEFRWIPQDIFEAYSTTAAVDPEMLAKLSAYTKAVKEGLDPDVLGLSLPEPIPLTAVDDASS